ncbi:two-component sensor histidine kinase [Corynebacterium macginleyi]|uniref:histidine kinase n=1 Tax=Corynebacterium macginleyi TaxID=38290 RepID=A0ABS1Y479_9CORY|nr:histidine kinase [Corynebacterium macginleyi]MBK4138526.1 two-component sensor histidine kinase [Corynebacterium macginleyi]MBK4153498.1 two-component sensor histidine kinase [Corynebacterium macginleyi]MBK4174737.1 two-component sensor histidine kinase [Corynebacterium macginleyi]MBM0243195.1 two-component sensor histidine kinase [Corynebacterium macginleyi]
MRTVKANAWSLVLGVLALPGLVVSVLMLPWIPLVARAAEFIGRCGARWMGVDIPPRRANRWFDWQQFYHLLLQLLICVACFANWVFVGFVAGVLVTAPFIPQAEFNVGEWTTDNRPLIFVVCWLAATVLFVLLVVLNRLLVKASISLTWLALSPSAQELAASRATLIDAFSGERRRIERELHDGPQQYLTALKLNLAAAKLQAPPEAQQVLADAEHNATHALSALRATVRGIAPQVLFDDGLIPALDELLAHSGLDAELHVDGAERSIEETTALLAYHAVAEALTNASTHGGATAATVSISFGDDLRLSVHDNGTGDLSEGGVPSASGPAHSRVGTGTRADTGGEATSAKTTGATAGTGLAGLHERAAALGGSVDFFPAHTEGQGATLTMSLPLKEAR